MQESTTNFIYFLACIGGLWFLIGLTKILWVLVRALLPRKDFQQRYGTKTWVVVTGGSDGIGLGFCEQFAALGFNICMIARNQAKMREALSRIKVDHEIQTKCIVADFVQCQKEMFFDRIAKQLKEIDVSVLVNNVGISNIGLHHQIAAERLLDAMNVNMVPMVMMSRMLLPIMLKRQRRSAIINVSSVAGENPLPYLGVYSATKAFNDFFSQGLGMECEHKVDVLSLRPMYVESNMSKMPPSCTVATRKQCVQATLGHLGLEYETNGFYMHRFLSWLASCLPTPILRCVAESESRKLLEHLRE